MEKIYILVTSLIAIVTLMSSKFKIFDASPRNIVALTFVLYLLIIKDYIDFEEEELNNAALFVITISSIIILILSSQYKLSTFDKVIYSKKIFFMKNYKKYISYKKYIVYKLSLILYFLNYSYIYIIYILTCLMIYLFLDGYIFYVSIIIVSYLLYFGNILKPFNSKSFDTINKLYSEEYNLYKEIIANPCHKEKIDSFINKAIYREGIYFRKPSYKKELKDEIENEDKHSDLKYPKSKKKKIKIRGYSDIYMQLVRSILLEDGAYNYAFRRKINEILYGLLLRMSFKYNFFYNNYLQHDDENYKLFEKISVLVYLKNVDFQLEHRSAIKDVEILFHKKITELDNKEQNVAIIHLSRSSSLSILNENDKRYEEIEEKLKSLHNLNYRKSHVIST